MNRVGLSQRLELRQSQALVMTPQLQQAIKLLQLSNLELGEFVEAEIEKNPLLELGEATARRGAADARRGRGAEPASAPLPLPEQLADGVGEVVGDAAEHWQAASGEDGDGSHDRGGDADAWHEAATACVATGRPEPAIERAADGRAACAST